MNRYVSHFDYFSMISVIPRVLFSFFENLIQCSRSSHFLFVFPQKASAAYKLIRARCETQFFYSAIFTSTLYVCSFREKFFPRSLATRLWPFFSYFQKDNLQLCTIRLFWLKQGCQIIPPRCKIYDRIIPEPFLFFTFRLEDGNKFLLYEEFSSLSLKCSIFSMIK